MWNWFSKKKSKAVKNHKCPCCGYYTIADDHGFPCYGDICNVCCSEMDICMDGTDDPSDANCGLTLTQAQKNYRDFGACHEKFIKDVRKPNPEELSGIDD